MSTSAEAFKRSLDHPMYFAAFVREAFNQSTTSSFVETVGRLRREWVAMVAVVPESGGGYQDIIRLVHRLLCGVTQPAFACPRAVWHMTG